MAGESSGHGLRLQHELDRHAFKLAPTTTTTTTTTTNSRATPNTTTNSRATPTTTTVRPTLAEAQARHDAEGPGPARGVCSASCSPAGAQAPLASAASPPAAASVAGGTRYMPLYGPEPTLDEQEELEYRYGQHRESCNFPNARGEVQIWWQMRQQQEIMLQRGWRQWQRRQDRGDQQRRRRQDRHRQQRRRQACGWWRKRRRRRRHLLGGRRSGGRMRM